MVQIHNIVYLVLIIYTLNLVHVFLIADNNFIMIKLLNLVNHVIILVKIALVLIITIVLHAP
jgi:hypothetical protein